MSNPEQPAEIPAPPPAATTPYAPPAAAPGPQPAKRPTGVWQLVVGIVLIALSLFNLPRGLVGIFVTMTEDGMVSPAVPLGVATVGAAFLVGGILLLVRSARIRAANRAAAAALYVPPAPPAA
jgi:hypothetical protein